MITASPMAETDQLNVMVDRLCRSIMRAPLNPNYKILTSMNHPFDLPGFDAQHYCHYLMEETANDKAPFYIVYYNSLEVAKEMKGLFSMIKEKIIYISLNAAQSYEEMIFAKAMLLAKESKSQALFLATAEYPYWYCTDAKGVFRNNFFASRRKGIKEVVSSEK